jgi:hypothetical protein
MIWRDIGYLMTKTNTLDKFNKPKPSYTETEVYCNKKSVGRTEFYQATAQGLKPELIVEVKQYNGADHFKLNDKVYRIIRSYTRNEEIYELTLTSTLVDTSIVDTSL